ncbi:MAG: tetratricopeptide repeat protein [Armatimonadetes bacterium]|nr:tetratricopeptide repeat protein [Armatimonadota bacterium]
MSEIDYPESFDRLMDEAADLMEDGDLAAAVPLLEEAARLVPDDPEVWQRLGTVRFSIGEWDAAEAAYRRWWEIVPQNVLAFRAYANLLFRRGKPDESEAVALAWLGREPGDAYAMLMIANARYKREEAYDSWLAAAQEADPELFERMMTQAFDYARGSGPGEWTSLQAAEYLEIPETRVIERAAAGSLPRHYNPESETFTFSRSDIDRRAEVLERYGLEEVAENASGEVIEIDYATDVEDFEEGEEVRVLLQKCPHCGEWTAGPLGDRETYFCCGEAMDPFIELSGEVEVRGRVIRKAGGGRELADQVRQFSPEQRAELRELWEEEQDWLSRAEEMLRERPERKPR